MVKKSTKLRTLREIIKVYNKRTQPKIKKWLNGSAEYGYTTVRNENIFRLPRFALNEEFGSLERFKLILKAKPLMVEDVSFKDSVLNADNLKFSFKTSTAPKDINCYVNNLASLKKENQGNVNHLIIKNLKLGTRYRINCTHISEKGNVFWFGKMFKRIN